jgi:hypothetical protein
MVAWAVLMPAALHASAVIPTGLSSAEYIRLARLHHRGALVTIPSTLATIPLTAATILVTAATLLLTAATLWGHSSIPVTDAATVLESAAPHTPSPQPSRSPRQAARDIPQAPNLMRPSPTPAPPPLSIDMRPITTYPTSDFVASTTPPPDTTTPSPNPVRPGRGAAIDPERSTSVT